MRRASFAWSPVRDWKNSRVPDLAMVPIFAITSSRDMPMPLSETVMVFAFSSKAILIFRSGSSPYRALFASASKRSLSAASEAFEISSRRKISLFEYKEWIIRLRSCRTSAWKPSVSFFVSAIGRSCAPSGVFSSPPLIAVKRRSGTGGSMGATPSSGKNHEYPPHSEAAAGGLARHRRHASRYRSANRRLWSRFRWRRRQDFYRPVPAHLIVDAGQSAARMRAGAGTRAGCRGTGRTVAAGGRRAARAARAAPAGRRRARAACAGASGPRARRSGGPERRQVREQLRAPDERLAA